MYSKKITKDDPKNWIGKTLREFKAIYDPEYDCERENPSYRIGYYTGDYRWYISHIHGVQTKGVGIGIFSFGDWYLSLGDENTPSDTDRDDEIITHIFIIDHQHFGSNDDFDINL